MKKKKVVWKDSNEILQGLRRSWGDIKPITKVIPNKKKNQKVKYKQPQFDFS